MFSHVEAYSGDSILSLNEGFYKDPRDGKVNLTIGVYSDENGKLPLMAAVRQAEQALAEELAPRPYLPMAGLKSYRHGLQRLIFGDNARVVADGRVATIQTPGGSAALKIAADFLKLYFPASSVWLSDPTWDNHRLIFERSGFEVKQYPYYHYEQGALRFDVMLDALSCTTPGDVVLLHACCHNPTGVDLTREQWLAIAETIRLKRLLPLVDIAYQGFGEGLEEDAFIIRELVRRGMPVIVASSFSKNFSLYGERCGGLSVVCSEKNETARVIGQLTSIVRGIYSNPPTHGAKIVAAVLGSPELYAVWEAELSQMRRRIVEMRKTLYSLLRERIDESPLSRYITQRGMFTYTGLSAEQVRVLNSEYAVYLVGSGRMCMAALNHGNIEKTAKAIADVMTDARYQR